MKASYLSTLINLIYFKPLTYAILFLLIVTAVRSSSYQNNHNSGMISRIKEKLVKQKGKKDTLISLIQQQIWTEVAGKKVFD